MCRFERRLLSHFRRVSRQDWGVNPLRLAAFLAFAVSCKPPSASEADARPSAIDGATTIDSAQNTTDASAAYRHTIVIDGTNDFLAEETFATTSDGYSAFVSWDVNNLYVGIRGADVSPTAPDSATKWVLIYLDADPGASTGQTMGEQYNTQRPGFPAGYGAEHYYRWKSDDTFADLRSWIGGSWQTAGVNPIAAVDGDFMEVAITRADIGDPAQLGVVVLMLNEKNLGEWSYAGLYADSFTDGYYDASTSGIPIGSYLLVDFSAARVPNDAANKKP